MSAATRSAGERVRVASVPSGHVYVRHLAPLDGSGAVRLPDPRPEQAANEQQWWPPVMLTPVWIDEHADEFDVFHVHFGFDALSPDELGAVVDRLEAHDKPLLYTVHDLRNPHQADASIHEAALDVLVPRATDLITLTTGAATEIWRRWGRSAHVLPHPHVVEPELLGAQRETRVRPRVGIHLKSLRANMNPLPVLRALAAEAPARGMDLVIDVHTDVFTPGMRNHDESVVEMLGAVERGGAEVHVHDYYSDDDLWDYFQSLDLSVLPYRFGTHSGWLEACFDLGTQVLAPRLGHYHDQHPGVLGYRLDGDFLRRDDIAAALDELTVEVSWHADAQWRLNQREVVAAAHEALYQSLAGR